MKGIIVLTVIHIPTIELQFISVVLIAFVASRVMATMLDQMGHPLTFVTILLYICEQYSYMAQTY